MNTQRKPELPADPWGHVEQRRQRQPAANDTRYGALVDDGKTEDNWTMLSASIIGLVIVVVGGSVAAWFVGRAIYKAWPDIAAHIASNPLFYAIGAVVWTVLIASAAWLQRRLDRKRLQREHAQRHIRKAIEGATK